MASFTTMSMIEIGQRVAPLLSSGAYPTYEEFHAEVQEIFLALEDDLGMTGGYFLDHYWPAQDNPEAPTDKWGTVLTPGYIPPREVSFWRPLYGILRWLTRLDFPDTQTCPLCNGTRLEPHMPGPIQCSMCAGLAVVVAPEHRHA